MRICVIFNPTAKGNKARRFRRNLDLLAGQCVFKATTGPGGGRALAAEAVRDGMNVIVAAGGDGTLNEVVNGVAEVPGGLRRAVVGVLPLGTVNVFAREVRMPLDFERAWQVIRAGRTRAVDLLEAQFSVQGRLEQRYSVQLGGAGLDARAIQLVDWQLKKWFGPLAYVVAGFHAVREPQPVIEVQAGAQRATAELVLIGNGRLYGGWFVLFPKATLDDGLLDLCLFPRVRWGPLSSCAWALLDGQMHRRAGAVHLQATTVQLRSSQPVSLQLEGETVGELPATVSVQPKALRVVVP